ncbi:Serine/threonine-protein phosphatase 6 regulatory ankyrin repeat subunit A [Tetrabaena socialis]|uniref:Serine/threonine-protein phosphatase 6 regulatory ankyrin repeat subunit A n=1 Tax=Tetrabaena socialis TaxID=47790 RepID=A0A2J8A553_9CHLO|nr:Serine/threonine-protein phosphatase 6 regulatory ankyrin repeat subunit A [Tetrabaena socialis]|eukprot:PNH07646.1 Serine/threonine-protein phosphatase 6 regulatory ankyrin repeat subunit A [Tetrabaena socialis]
MGNCVSSSASAPLFDAIAGGDAPAAVGVISANPALLHKRNGSQRRTAYHACASDGQQEVLKQICALVWRSVPDTDGVVHGDAGALVTGRQHPTILLAINAYDQAGLTPLILACQKGHLQVTELLLLQGADPWIGDRLMGRSPLHHAASANHQGCIQAILSSPLVSQVGKASGRLAECK